MDTSFSVEFTGGDYRTRVLFYDSKEGKAIVSTQEEFCSPYEDERSGRYHAGRQVSEVDTHDATESEITHVIELLARHVRDQEWIKQDVSAVKSRIEILKKLIGRTAV